MAKLRNAVAVAEAGRRGQVHYLRGVVPSDAATRNLVLGQRRETVLAEIGPLSPFENPRVN